MCSAVINFDSLFKIPILVQIFKNNDIARRRFNKKEDLVLLPAVCWILYIYMLSNTTDLVQV